MINWLEFHVSMSNVNWLRNAFLGKVQKIIVSYGILFCN